MRRPRYPRLLLLSLTAVLAVSVVGCATSTGAAPTTPPPASASQSASPTPSPTPTATPSPAMDPADPATWLITTSSIGPAQLGDWDDAQITAALSGAFIQQLRCEGLTAYGAIDPALPITASTAVSGLTTPEHPGYFRAVSVSAPEASGLGAVEGSPRTAEGIGLGSTVRALEQAYPDLESWTDPRGEPQPGFADFIVTDEGGTLLFTVADEHVMTITATFDLPQVGYCS